MHDVISATICLLPLVVEPLLGGPYLRNRLVDFVHFLQANCYDIDYLTIRNSAQSEQYLSRERISQFPWQPIGILKFRFREVFFVPHPDLHAEFGLLTSVNVRVVSAQTNNVTLLKL